MPTNNDYWNQPPVQPQSQSQPQQQQQQQYAPPQPQPQSQFTPAYAQAVPYQVVQQKKSHGWIVAIVIVVCFFLFSIFCVASCTSLIGSFNPYGSTETELTGDAVAVINIDGTIQYDNTACSPEGLKGLLDEAAENEHIKAVVLRVNSGGGTATAGEEMAEYVREFAEKKPIVVSSASINASAAYEISSQADYIFVAKSTEIGAIGTAMQITDISGLLDMLGVNMEVITSSDEKDSSYGYRPLTDEERAEYQHMVDQINEVFLENVAAGRDMNMEEVRKLATGMPFTGIDAVENGLADEIGTREDAIEKAAELAGISDYTVTELYIDNYDFSTLSYLLGEYDVSVDDLAALLEKEKGSRLY